jgi:hypothetical protein
MRDYGIEQTMQDERDRDFSPVTGSFSVAARKNPNLTAHLSDMSAQNFALDLGKVKRIVVPNQPNAVRPDSTVD